VSRPGETCSTHGEINDACKILAGRYQGTSHLKDERIILKLILEKYDVKLWIGFH
jgi:hypothetical protein